MTEEQGDLFAEPDPPEGDCPHCGRGSTLAGPGQVGAFHPDTSRHAAVSVSFGDQRWECLAAIAASPSGLTAYEVTRLVSVDAPNQVAARLLELRRNGYTTYALDEDGVRVRRPTLKSHALVQVATNHGLDRIAQGEDKA